MPKIIDVKTGDVYEYTEEQMKFLNWQAERQANRNWEEWSQDVDPEEL